MLTEKSQGPFYAHPEAYYPGYQGSSASEQEVFHEEIPVSGSSPLSSSPYQQSAHWLSSSRLQPEQRGKVTPVQRMILAIISVGMTALFSMIVLTSTQNNTSAGVIGITIMSGAICLINLIFNRGE